MQIIASASTRGARVGRIVAFTESGKGGNVKFTPVKFSIRQKIHFGSHIAVVGSKPALGSWNPAQGLELTWNEDDVWTAEAKLDLNDEVDFKFVIVEPEDEIKWQPGENVVLAVPEDASEVLVEAGSFESSKIVIKPIKSETKLEIKAEKKIPEMKKETIASVSAPDVARSNIMSKASSPDTAAVALAISSATPSIAEIEKMTLTKIKEIMVKMGLETTGKKSDLIARIRSHLQT